MGDFGVFKKALLMVNHPSLIAWSLWPKDLSKVVVSDDGLDDALKPFEAERTTIQARERWADQQQKRDQGAER